MAGGRGRVKLKADVRVWFCRSDLGVRWSGGVGAVGFYEVERGVRECKKRVCTPSVGTKSVGRWGTSVSSAASPYLRTRQTPLVLDSIDQELPRWCGGFLSHA